MSHTEYDALADEETALLKECDVLTMMSRREDTSAREAEIAARLIEVQDRLAELKLSSKGSTQ